MKHNKLKSEVLSNNAELIEERVRMEAFKIEAQSKIEWLQRKLEAKSDLFNKVAQERDKLKTESVTNNEKAAELIKLVEERLRMDALRTESQSKIDYLQNQLEVKSNLITEVTQERDKFKSECLTNNGKVAKLIEENLRMDAIKTESQSKIESLQNLRKVYINLIIEVTLERDKLKTESVNQRLKRKMDKNVPNPKKKRLTILT